jgi:hypothetical protein
VILPIRTDYEEVDAFTALASDYEVREAGMGLLTLSVIDPHSGDAREIRFRGNPWNAIGFFVHVWPGRVLVLGAYERIAVISLSSMTPIVSMAVELEETKTLSEPVVVTTDAALLVATDSRLLCVLASGTHWIWSTRAFSTEWCGISGLPTIVGDRVHLTIEGAKICARLELDLHHGVVVTAHREPSLL